jgi:uncharacterized membrane protein
MPKPVIKLTYSFSDYLAEGFSLSSLVFIPVYLMINYSDLPDRIPTGFDSSGAVRSTGGAETLLLLVFFSLFTYVGITVVSRFPHVHNYPVKVTDENASVLYRLSQRMLIWLKLSCMLLFAYIIYASIQIGLGFQSQLDTRIMLVLLGITLIIPIGTVIWMLKYRSSTPD